MDIYSTCVDASALFVCAAAFSLFLDGRGSLLWASGFMAFERAMFLALCFFGVRYMGDYVEVAVTKSIIHPVWSLGLTIYLLQAVSFATLPFCSRKIVVGSVLLSLAFFVMQVLIVNVTMGFYHDGDYRFSGFHLIDSIHFNADRYGFFVIMPMWGWIYQKVECRKRSSRVSP